MTQEIDTADHVYHAPTGETWVVARVRGEIVEWCGYPAGGASLHHCVLTHKATPEQRLALLRELADSRHPVAAWARIQASIDPLATAEVMQKDFEQRQRLAQSGEWEGS